MDTKRSVLVILLMAALLVSMVGMASATSQTWYLTNAGSGVDPPAKYQMHKDSGSGTSNSDKISKGGSDETWAADQTAGGSCDMSGPWQVEIDYYVSSGSKNDPSKVRVDMGYISGISFTSKGYGEKAVEKDSGLKYRSFSDSISTSGFTIPGENDYLAMRITNTGDLTHASVYINLTGAPNSPSYINSPSSDPGYPVPELSTLLLTSIGALMLGGFVLYSRRRNNK